MRGDQRVVALEQQDARGLTSALIPVAINAIVVDVSFISLLKVLPAAFALAHPGAWLIALIKPQFEVGPDFVGKGGIVRDEAAKQRAVADVSEFIAKARWRVAGTKPSPLRGGSGNEEFLIGAVLNG